MLVESIKEVVVVEGKDDTRRLVEVFGMNNIETIETNGSAIDETILSIIEKAHQKRGVIVFTDPDFSGEQIRKIITKKIPTVKHAFLVSEKARPNQRKSKRVRKSLGVEHARDEDIKLAINSVRTVASTKCSSITKKFLIKHGLIGMTNSDQLRRKLCQRLNIGQVNGKQLEKRLNMFGITELEILQVLSEIL